MTQTEAILEAWDGCAQYPTARRLRRRARRAYLYPHRSCRGVAMGGAAIALADTQGFAWSSAQARFCRGWALMEQGLGAEGVMQIRQSLTAWRATGAEVGVTLVLAKLAEAYGHVGQATEGLAVLSEARDVVDKTEEGWWKAELHRLKGELLLSLSPDNRTEAEACFQQALNIGRHQHAKSWELRAATSLARLWQSQGRPDEAHDLLAPVYD